MENISLTLVFDLLCCMFTVVFFWSTMVLVLGLIRKGRRHPVAKKKLRFAVLVCARNEECVIEQPVRSVLEAEYPKDCREIFVLADNCTDKTAEIARAAGATVWEKTSPSSGKGDVLAWGIERIREHGGFDAVAVFDADNTVDRGWFNAVNDALNDKECVVTGCRRSSNIKESIISGWYAVYWSMMNELSNRVRTNLSLSGKLTGTGFAFLLSVLGDSGWRTRTMVEDVEFTIQGNLAGRRVAYVAGAGYSDEQPVTLSAMWRQLCRWETGGWQVVFYYFFPWVVTLLKKPSLRLFDSFFSILTGFSVAFIHFANVMALVAKLCAGYPIDQALKMFWGFVLLVFAMGWLTAAISVALSDKKSRPGLLPIVTFPLFSLVLSASALFTLVFPVRRWKPIPHGRHEQK